MLRPSTLFIVLFGLIVPATAQPDSAQISQRKKDSIRIAGYFMDTLPKKEPNRILLGQVHLVGAGAPHTTMAGFGFALTTSKKRKVKWHMGLEYVFLYNRQDTLRASRGVNYYNYSLKAHFICVPFFWRFRLGKFAFLDAGLTIATSLAAKRTGLRHWYTAPPNHLNTWHGELDNPVSLGAQGGPLLRLGGKIPVGRSWLLLGTDARTWGTDRFILTLGLSAGLVF